MTTIMMTNRSKCQRVCAILPMRNSNRSHRPRIESTITTTIGPQAHLLFNQEIVLVIAPPPAPARPLPNIPRRRNLWNAKTAAWNTRKIPVTVRPIRAILLRLKVLMSHAPKDCVIILQVCSFVFVTVRFSNSVVFFSSFSEIVPFLFFVLFGSFANVYNFFFRFSGMRFIIWVCFFLFIFGGIFMQFSSRFILCSGSRGIIFKIISL